MFELQTAICDRFKGLTPFDIRKITFHELCVFIKRMNRHNQRENKKQHTKSNDTGIRRPAADDSWY